MQHFKHIIIGGGASGLYLGTLLNDALILEKDNLGKKIIIAGGGNCNFSNKNISPKNYYSQNPNFSKHILESFNQQDLFNFLKKNKLDYYEKNHGRLFVKQGGQSFLDALIRKQKAKARTNYEIKSITKEGKFFIVNNEYTTYNLIIATGGLAMGGSDFGLKIAKQFGLKIIPPVPALVRFDLDSQELLELSGLSVQDVKSMHFKDGIVFTKKGIGGPLIYQISLYYKTDNIINLDFSECSHIPKRLRKLLNQKKELQLKPKKTAGFKFSEVMAGGIDVNEIIPTNLMSKKCEGLFFMGEVLDVTGNLGGYNLHFAFACANTIASYLGKGL